MQTSATVITDSCNDDGDRLTTVEVTCHRFVLSELNTHRTFSRNSASSRAIPVEKQLERLRSAPAFPVEWPREQPGMQGGDELVEQDYQDARNLFEELHGLSLASVTAYLERHPTKASRLHKSLINRLLEPFMWHTAVITATDYTGFFEQRCSPLAQAEIRRAAEAMRDAIQNSVPKSIKQGQWHLPYIQEDELGEPINILGKVSAARCARTSYLTQDGKRGLSDDLKLYERLVSARPAHWSPLEHPATPDQNNRITVTIEGEDFDGNKYALNRLGPRYGNFTGWRQHRAEMEAQADWG